MSIDTARAWLEAARNEEGSWGYLPGQPGRGEPTVLAAAAGLDASLAWLRDNDLGYAALLVPAALSGRPDAAELRRAATEEILALHGEQVDRDQAPYVTHDTTLVGWGWVSHTSSWVEPTAYALISLKKEGLGDRERVQEGEALLRNRQCYDGGWNYGNIQVFDAKLAGFPGPTAWAVMALPPGPEVERGLARLQDVTHEASGQSLSLALLARVAHDHDQGDLPALLAARQREDGSFDNRVDTTALALLALRAAEEGTHVFDLTP